MDQTKTLSLDNKAMKDLLAILFLMMMGVALILSSGCTTNLDVRPYPDEPDYPWTGESFGDLGQSAHSDAAAALAFSTRGLYVPDGEPDGGGDDVKPGDKCPDCNDPPGACGVGRVGDGRICQTCDRCKGDGIIHESDLEQAPRFPGVTQITMPSPVCDCENGGPCICEVCECPNCTCENCNGIPAPEPDPVPDAEAEAAQDLGYALQVVELRQADRDLSNRVNSVERRLEALEKICKDCGKCLTEEDVRQIVREEMQVLIKGSDGKLRTESVKVTQTPKTPIINSKVAGRSETRVPGYSGTFELAPGEKIVSVGGVPIRSYSSQPIRLEGGDVIPSYISNAGPVRMQAIRTTPQRTRVQLFRPFSSFGSSASCATGNCSGGR